jgi:ferredoxin
MFNLEQVDVIRGDVESIIIEHTLATLERLTALGRRPKILMVFVSCIDGFIGTDHEYVLDQLRAAAPDVIFMDLAVDPINRDVLPPLVRLHKTVAALFEKTGDEPAALWLGSYLPPAGDDSLRRKLEAAGLASRHLSDCETLEELRALGNCRFVVAATKVAGRGPVICKYGCLGFGNCVKACPTGAISLENGVAKVKEELCIGCMQCATACPRGVIVPVVPGRQTTIPCASLARGPATNRGCTVGCVACSACVKACPKGAITIEKNLAVIDYGKCDHCGLCVKACPKGLIVGRSDS